MPGIKKQNAPDGPANPGDKGTPPQEGERFDDLMGRLKAIVERLEGSDLTLEDSLAQFEQGMALSSKGQAILDAAEQRVEKLLQDGSTEPLDAKAD